MILFENSDLIIVNKPSNLVSYCDLNPDASLAGIISSKPGYEYLLNLPRYGLVHRLDKDSTGALIIAKHIKSLSNLSNLMKSKIIERRYLVLVHGNPKKKVGMIRCYLKKDHSAGRMRKVGNSACAYRTYYSETIYSCQSLFKNYSLFECELNTGRTHQIRVHLESINHCVVGDLVYNRIKLNSIKRQMLHAYKIHIPSYNLTIDAPIPKDFALVIDKLNKNPHYLIY